MTRLSQMFRPALFGLAALLAGAPAQAQLVETVKDYVITIEENSSDCDAARNVGDLCGPELNVVYLGEGPSGRKLFTTDVTLPATNWNDGGTTTDYMALTNVSSGALGAQNTSSLLTLDANVLNAGVQTHRATATCANLTHGGFDDWYLPSSLEAHLFFRNSSGIPVSPGTIWTSSEYSQIAAYAFETGTGNLTATSKAATRSIQCVRSGTVPLTPAKPCETVTEIGEACGNGGVVYAGPALSGEGLFSTTFSFPAVTWNNGMTTTGYMALTNVQSGVNGEANSAALAVRDADTLNTGTQKHFAAEYCENMTYGGYNDWYLPGSAEIHTLFLNRAALPVKTGALWTSSEYDQTSARAYDLGTGAASAVSKASARSLICVRRGATAVPAGAPCADVTEIGGACGTGEVVYAGEELGQRLYTTSFSLPVHPWNNGMTTTTYMRLTNMKSETDGAANTTWLSANDADTLNVGVQPHAAAEICENLNYLGFEDWYLPAPSDTARLAASAASLPAMGAVWTSAENTQTTAVIYDTATGTRSNASKNWSYAVRCVRKDPLPPGMEPVTFAYTGTVQTWTAPVTGVYRLTGFGAEGAPGTGTTTAARNGAGGQGGYAEGEILLNAGATVRVYVGGAGSATVGGWNGGGAGYTQSTNRISGGGGGATDFRIGGTSLYDRVLVAGGGGGGAGAATSGGGSPGGGGGGGYFGGGGGGGSTGSDSSSCQAPTTEGAFGRFGFGGEGGASGCYSGTYYAPGNGGPGGALAADSGSTNTTRGFGGDQNLGGGGGVRVIAGSSAGGGGGGGSGYVGGVMNGSVTAGGRSGNGLATIQYLRSPGPGDAPVSVASRWFFDYTGAAQNWSVPVSGRYRVTAHGARGSDGAAAYSDAQNAQGGLGALAIGEITLSAGTEVNVYVGERPMDGDGSAGVTGGWNGGGNGATQSTSRMSGGGGGATDIRIGGTALANRVLVAGGGGGGAGASQTGGGAPGGGGGGGYYGGGGGGGYTGSTTSSCQTNTFSGSAGALGVGGSGGNANCTSGTYRAPNAGGNAGLVGAAGGAATTRGGGATQYAGGAGGVRSLAGTASGGGGGGGSSWVTGTASFPITNGSVATSTRRWHGFVTIEYLGP